MTERIRIIPQAELVRRQEIRHQYLVPICVMWTSNVPSDRAQAALQGVSDALDASGQRRDLTVVGSQRFALGDFSDGDWYVDTAFRRQTLRRDAGFGLQVDVEEIQRLFYQEPWQVQPHWEVFVINHDLNTRGEDGSFINFVFGSTRRAFPASIQSVRRLESVRDPNLRNDMTRRLLRHEVGHMFGLPNRNYNIEHKLGDHCTNICTMRQGMSIQEWAELTIQERTRNLHFCNDCLNDLERIRPRYKPLPQ
ncbi:MAG: hypothetical protein M1268_02710 [Patescibacteria group bacterium]|nr:hypothetical protein [Patescibacteria group bacterium]